MTNSGSPRQHGNWKETLLPIGLVLVWLTLISLGFGFILGRPSIGDQSRFLLTAALAGAFGSLSTLSIPLHAYFRSCWHQELAPQWVPINNLLIKPLLYPIGGMGGGLILALVFLEIGVSDLRVLLLGLVGGVLWNTVYESLPSMFGLGAGKKLRNQVGQLESRIQQLEQREESNGQ